MKGNYYEFHESRRELSDQQLFNRALDAQHRQLEAACHLAERHFVPMSCPQCGKPTVDEQGNCLCGWTISSPSGPTEPRDLSVGEDDNE